MIDIDVDWYICSSTKILLRIIDIRPIASIIKAPHILALPLNRVIPEQSEGPVGACTQLELHLSPGELLLCGACRPYNTGSRLSTGWPSELRYVVHRFWEELRANVITRSEKRCLAP
jgi:hypothetical protein